MVKGCRTLGSELFLPEELIAFASRWGNEYAWRKKDLLHVAALAGNDLIASGGWQVLFRTPDGNCELYWNSFYPEEMRSDESWGQFVSRSWEESKRSWRMLFEDEGLIEEGRRAFRLFLETEIPGLLPRDALWFVLYFKRSTQISREPQKELQQDAPGLYGG
jgi:hypothetical protein